MSIRSACFACPVSQYAFLVSSPWLQVHHLCSALVASNISQLLFLPPTCPTSQSPPPSIWTLAICRNGHLCGASLPTDDKLQISVLHMIYMLAPALLFWAHLQQFPTSTFCSSYKKKKKSYSPNKPHPLSARCVCIYSFLSREHPSSLPSHSRLKQNTLWSFIWVFLSQ